MKQVTREYGKRQKLAKLLLILGGIVAAGLLLYALGTRLEQAEKDPLATQAQEGLPSVRFKEDQTLEYQGQRYKLRKNLTSLLLIGVDKADGAEAPDLAFRSGGQADYLSLMVIDDRAKTVRRINIDRDTMTDITVLSALGKPKGTRRAQISLAHGFGGDPEQAAELTIQAAENLLQGVSIDGYVAFTMDAISTMNDLVGGVSVLIEEDLTAIDPAFVNGQQVVLSGDQAERFVRARKGVTGGTNLNRMRRQNAFITAFFQQVAIRMREDAGFVNRLLNNLSPAMTSSLRLGRLASLLYRTRGYEAARPFTLQGERRVNALNNVELYPEEGSVMMAILGAFYEEVPAAALAGD